jgi:hypothetical protein
MTPASYAAITAHQGITDHQGSVMGDPHRRSTLNLPTNHFSRIIDGEAVACGEDASRCSSVLVTSGRGGEHGRSWRTGRKCSVNRLTRVTLLCSSANVRVEYGSLAGALPTSAKQPPSGPGWWIEIKHDGFRVIGRLIRLKKGLTQEQFADVSGFSQQYLSGLESGHRNPTG